VFSPAVSGNIVVWEDLRNGNYDIYGYNIETATEFAVYTDSANQEYPAVSGNIVVWQDWRNGNADIYAYDIETATKFVICSQLAYQTYPAVSGNVVVWRDVRNGNYDIYGYDIETRTHFAVCTDSTAQHYPAISGNIIVWQDYRNGNYDIYGYNIETATEFAVCTEFAGQQFPAVSGIIIVWRDYRNGNYDVYADADIVRAMNSKGNCNSAIEIIDDIGHYGTSKYVPGGSDMSSCGYNDIYDAWNIYTPTQGGSVTITTDGSTFDTVLCVFEGCGGSELVCNDDYCPDNTQSKVTLDVVKGKSYFARVSGFNGQRGDYNLLITRGACVNPPQMDANDDCKVDMIDFAIFASEWLTCGLDDYGSCWE
jgi:beta propeller repeat protein